MAGGGGLWAGRWAAGERSEDIERCCCCGDDARERETERSSDERTAGAEERGLDEGTPSGRIGASF